MQGCWERLVSASPPHQDACLEVQVEWPGVSALADGIAHASFFICVRVCLCVLVVCAQCLLVV